MPILGIAYAAIGAAVGYNTFQEVQRGRFAVDMVLAAAGEDSLLSPETLRLVADVALVGITAFAAAAWPVVILYDEVEKAARHHRAAD